MLCPSRSIPVSALRDFPENPATHRLRAAFIVLHSTQPATFHADNPAGQLRPAARDPEHELWDTRGAILAVWRSTHAVITVRAAESVESLWRAKSVIELRSTESVLAVRSTHAIHFVWPADSGL